MLSRLTLPPFFRFDSVVRSHGWYDLPPYSYDAKQQELSTVLGGPVKIVFRARGGVLESRAASGGTAPLRTIARRVFSLDLDLSAFDGALENDPLLRRALRRGGGRMLRAPTVFEDAVKMLLTTNCTWAATRLMVVRLIALAGDGGQAFPSPEAIARFSPGTLNRKVRCGYRALSLSRFARRVASGRLDLSQWERPDVPADRVREAIVSEHGFGPYAAEGLLRILGRHDFLALDSWVRKQYRNLHPGPVKTVDRSIARRYARFGEHKGLALWLELTAPWHEAGKSS